MSTANGSYAVFVLDTFNIPSAPAGLAAASRPWQYVEAMAQQMFGVRYVDWLDIQQLTKFMQALIIDGKRRKKAEE
ncbi:hypothetical protein KHDHEBDM_03978 [Pectobacterium polaris]|nr:hypothetical protein KHDHEBDM_03978 [Pectobacterium polaris]